MKQQKLIVCLLSILFFLLQYNFLFAAGYGTGGSSTTCNVSGKKVFSLIVQETKLNGDWFELLTQQLCNTTTTSGNIQPQTNTCDPTSCYEWRYLVTNELRIGDSLTCEGQLVCVDYYTDQIAPDSCCIPDPHYTSNRIETVDISHLSPDLFPYHLTHYLMESGFFSNSDGTYTYRYIINPDENIVEVGVVFGNDFTDPEPLVSIDFYDNNSNKINVFNGDYSTISVQKVPYIDYYIRFNSPSLTSIEYLDVTFKNEDLASSFYYVYTVSYSCNKILNWGMVGCAGPTGSR